MLNSQLYFYDFNFNFICNEYLFIVLLYLYLLNVYFNLLVNIPADVSYVSIFVS